MCSKFTVRHQEGFTSLPLSFSLSLSLTHKHAGSQASAAPYGGRVLSLPASLSYAFSLFLTHTLGFAGKGKGFQTPKGARPVCYNDVDD